MELSDFLNGFTSVSLYSHVLYAQLGSTKKCCVAQKTVVSTKKKSELLLLPDEGSKSNHRLVQKTTHIKSKGQCKDI